MRVVSGIAGGIRLDAPKGRDTRPTTDRTKEALFATLGDIRGWKVSDLFAGSGALGIEALSRGAEEVIFIERDNRAIATIRTNLCRVMTAFPEGARPQYQIARTDVSRVMGRFSELSGKLDLILADPPYHPQAKQDGAGDLLTDVRFADWARGALLVLEHETGTQLPWHPHGPWTLLKLRQFGTQTLAYARIAPEHPPTASSRPLCPVEAKT